MKRAIVIAALMLAFAARAQDAAPWWNALAADGAEGLPDVTDGLIGWWKLEEGTGTTAYDSSGNGRHGTLVNNPVWANGINGRAALSMNNGVANQEVSIADFQANGSKPVTVMAFAKARLPQSGGFGSMAGWGIGAPGQWFYVGWVIGGVGAYPSFGGGTYSGDIGSGVTDLTGFHHIAITYAGGSSGQVNLYADGALTYVTTMTLNLPGAFRIGRGADGTTPSYFFNGAISNVRVYNRALSSNEVNTIYNRYK